MGGVGSMVAIGGASFDRAGAGVVVAKAAEVREGGVIGLALAPRVDVQPGGRVIVGLREAAIGGAVAGIVIGLIAGLVRRGR
jgi:hypothetical protein